jgi:hypothetical protein
VLIVAAAGDATSALAKPYAAVEHFTVGVALALLNREIRQRRAGDADKRGWPDHPASRYGKASSAAL